MKRFLARFGAISFLFASVSLVHAVESSPPQGSPLAVQGWHFYVDPALPEEKEAVPPRRVEPESAKSDEVRSFERMQEDLQRFRTVAIMAPTEANVRRYMEQEALVIDKAARFADVARRVGWSSPNLDAVGTARPATSIGAQVYDLQQNRQRDEQLAALGRDHVLLFFFRSDCPYCHAYAPVLKRFESTHGLKVVGVSVDGPGLPEYPSPRADNGIAARLGVSQVPAVFLAQPFTGTITPLGIGLLSESELKERVTTVAGTASDGAFGAIRQQPLN